MLTNSNGKTPCTASADPVRSAIAAMKPPMLSPMRPPANVITAMPAGPERMLTPNGIITSVKNSASMQPNNALPASRPMRMLTRLVGDASSRSKKPVSMSTASAAPPVTEPKMTPCNTLAAKVSARNESTFGKPGSCVARLNDDAPSAAKNNGKINEGIISAGWRTIAMMLRFDIAIV
ncbi:unannotated protein [freshwater metagenome]|uniref:Unannotated protein n=1 Tax=freshwater metagenome TaxID=449393 RepID=A0A6J6YDY0_9ZZZZ